MATIAVITPNGGLPATLAQALEDRGHSVVVVPDSPGPLSPLFLQPPDAVLLLALPGQRNAAELCLALRRRLNVPIIVLADDASELERANALEQGADAFLHTYDLRELLLRMDALLRRYAEKKGAAEPVAREVQSLFATGVMRLSPKEASLLAYLVSHKGGFVPTEDLLDAFWSNAATDDSLRVHVQRLRKKLALQEAGPYRLATLRGWGYGLLPATEATGPPIREPPSPSQRATRR